MIEDDASNFSCAEIPSKLFPDTITRELPSDVNPNTEVYEAGLNFNNVEMTSVDVKYSLYPDDTFLLVMKNGLNFTVLTSKLLPQANAVYLFVLQVETDTAVALFELQSNRRIVCVNDVDLNSIRISSDAIGHVVTLSLTSSGQVVLAVKVAVIVASTRLTIPENNLPNKNVVTFSSLRESFDIEEQHHPVDLPLILTPNRTAIQLTRGLDFEKDPKSFQNLEFKLVDMQCQIRDSAGIIEATKKLPEDAGPNGIVINVTVSDGVNTSPTPTKVIIYVSSYTQEFELVGGNYSLSIVENIPVGTEVFNSSLTNYTGYQLLPASVLYFFTINQTTGIIRTFREIDREGRVPQENMNVVAFQGNEICKLKTVSNITLTILDENDNPPVFDTSFSATDKDYKENATLTYSITSGNSPFRIDSATGNVTVADSSRLDREFLDTLRLNVTVVDGGAILPQKLRKSASIDLTVTLEDENDNDPIFNQSVYTISVYENISINSNLIVVRATDRDIYLNGEIRYSLGDGGGMGFFSINITTGQLRNRVALDREQYESFNFTVIASDLGSPPRSSLASIMVKVLDVNDNIPQFKQAIYLATIDEGISCWNKSFVKVTAEDKDFGSNGEIVYNLQSDLLVINSSTGEVTCQAAGLDYENETQRTFEVVVRASDKGTPPLNSTSVIRVTLRDVNDNAPVFINAPYNISVRVETFDTLDSPIFVFSVQDKDSGENREVDFRLTNPSPDGAGLLTVSNLVLRVNRTGRPSLKTFSYTVIATDRGRPPLSSSASVYIYVSDYGTSRVTFDPKDFLVKIVEEKSYDESSGTPIDQLTITKQSFPPVFSLVGASSFSVNSSTGHLFSSKVWDRERDKDSAELTIMAKASVGADVDYALVRIILLDINDNSPTILTNPSALLGTVGEDAAQDTFIISLEATDPDEGRNGTVIFSLTSGTRKVRDNAMAPRSVSTSVTILIEDVNDNAPTFVNVATVIVPENTQRGEEVAIVNATDPDKGKNGTVTYLIDNSTACPFEIQIVAISQTEKVGILLLIEDLDYETVNKYTCIIEASDQGDIRLSSTASFTILVTDINDNAPVIHSAIQVNISDNTTTPQFNTIYNVNITEGPLTLPLDLTQVSAFVYENKAKIDPCNCSYTIENITSEPNVSLREIFDINAVSGEITLKAFLDREVTGNFIRITLLAAFGEVPRKTGTATLTINVLDVNDNSPKFSTDSLTLNINESSCSAGQVVYNVTAHDADAPPNNIIVYSLLQLSPDTPLKVDNSSGQLSLNASLCGVQNETITAIVKATDMLDPEKKNIITLRIKVNGKDPNPNAPTFLKDKYQSVLSFDASVDSTLTIIDFEAKDKDESQNITYSIVNGNFRELFTFDSETRVFRLKYPIDVTVPNIVNITVKATDSGDFPLVYSKTGYAEVQIKITERSKQCYTPGEVSALSNQADKFQLFQSLFIAVVILLVIAIITSVIFIYKWRTAVSAAASRTAPGNSRSAHYLMEPKLTNTSKTTTSVNTPGFPPQLPRRSNEVRSGQMDSGDSGIATQQLDSGQSFDSAGYLTPSDRQYDSWEDEGQDRRAGYLSAIPEPTRHTFHSSGSEGKSAA
ncbi:hypothetical protein C0Q70_19941 [Pomacea canaliculata]|uniref:Cadherin domain-containing protein n=1 Tax=Pomacea canaliculata TaxID=400727 RepID=A0A2T7NE87_POMCA|nr:hypothetical protein C0Q70_19941 [Pomacea canaliculata]